VREKEKHLKESAEITTKKKHVSALAMLMEMTRGFYSAEKRSGPTSKRR